MLKNMFSIFRVISILFHFKLQSLEKQPGFETSRCDKVEYLLLNNSHFRMIGD